MNILHISGNFTSSKLYQNLFIKLENLNISQSVYSGVRDTGKLSYDLPKSISIYVRSILNILHRLFYRLKIKTIYGDILSCIDLRKVSVVHAHTLYSDGGVALMLKVNHNIPYIVAVRNTDVNVFMKYRPDLKFVRDKILCNASHIVLLSPAYRDKLRMMVSFKLWSSISKRVSVIPNGVDDFWLDDRFESMRIKSSVIRLIYVGDFSKNKNVVRLISAVKNISLKNNVTLTLVGGGGREHNKIISMVSSKKYPFLEYIGYVDDRKKLKKIFTAHDIFVMPSFHETFGLVYAEALSQGLPILCSKGEGIESYFINGVVSESVNPSDLLEIESKILYLISRYKEVREKCINESKKFDWEIIARNYRDIYIDIAGEL